MQNYAETILFWLQPSHITEEDLREDIDSLQEIIKDTRVFYDRDQCIETLPSIVDQTIFLVLGPGQSDLVDILSGFTYLDYVYLQETSHSPYTSQVRGVFPQTKQLLHQLKKDIKTVHNTYTHLGLSRSGELQQPQNATQNLQCRAVEFKWIQLLFDVLLNVARPTENIYKDLLDECRLIYRGNEAQTRFIDEFAAEYEPSKAIWWYTRDTFLYRLINMALRTENMVIIWKFRYIIQDIHQQLKSMHGKQKNATIEGNQQQCRLMVYRGQFISIIELESLKKAEGGLIATTSFFSTTRDHQVAHCFADAVEKPLNLEPVMFEICIEQSNQDERRPFADISEVSLMKHEGEILLCMGTVMRVDSVELGEDMTRIRLTTCQYNNSAWQHSEVNLLPCESFNTNLEIISLFKLGVILLSMGEYKKGEQFLKMIKSSNDPAIKSMCQFYLIGAKMGQKSLSDPDYLSSVLMVTHEWQKLCQSIADRESIPDFYRECSKLWAEDLANCAKLLNSKDKHTINSEPFLQTYNEMLEHVEKYVSLLALPLFDPSGIKSIRLFPELTESNDEKMKLEMYERLRFNIDRTLVENDPSRASIFLTMAGAAEKEGNYDRAIALAREGLSMTCRNNINVEAYKLLARIYEKQKNWPAVMESWQSIIDMPQIAPSSSSIVEAHLARGDACAKFDDLSEALINYTNALQLQDQHHMPNHPLTSEIYIKIGDVFEKTKDVFAALEYYHKAISFGFPDTSSKAYKMIGIMYMLRRNYDQARSNFMKCLEIQQNSIPHETFLLACTYTWLAHVEHRSGCIHQRDLNIQQARTIVILDEDEREFIVQHISEILAEAVPTTSELENNILFLIICLYISNIKSWHDKIRLHDFP